MYKEIILIHHAMGKLENGFRDLRFSEVKGRSSLRRAVLMALVAVGVSPAAKAEDGKTLAEVDQNQSPASVDYGYCPAEPYSEEDVIVVSQHDPRSDVTLEIVAEPIASTAELETVQKTFTEAERPLQAIPEYSDNQDGWRELYQAQIDESLEYRDAHRLFMNLRIADLGYENPKEAPRDLILSVMSDYNDWQSLVWKNKTDSDTDEFLADLASR